MARGFASGRAQAVGRTQRVDPQLGGGGGEPPPDTAPIITSGPTLVSKTSTTVTLTWTANQFVQSWLEYGPTTGYGSESEHEESFAYSTHTQTITGLTADTTYHFRPVVVNNVSETTRGSDIAVTTDSVVSPAASDNLYGIWQPMTGVGNLRLLQDFGPGTVTVASYRFRASRTGYIRSIRWSNTTGSGYSSGSPTARISLQADDGTSVHRPTRVILSQCPNFTPASSDNAGTLSTFSTPYQVTAGVLYHVVFENLSSDTSANTYSINAIVTDFNPVVSTRWGAGSVDFAALMWNSGQWYTESGVAHRNGYWPIMDLSYSDTPSGAIVAHQGQGFVSLGDADLITGNTQVRERIIVSGGNKTVVGVIPFCERVSGTDPLTITLETTPGTALATAAFPYTDFATGDGIRNHAPGPNPVVERLFSVARSFGNGETFYVRLSTPSSSTYMTEAITKGTGWGYDSSLVFSDGVRQKGSSGATGSFTTMGNTDVQVMLRLGS